jgi:hypothetical protein
MSKKIVYIQWIDTFSCVEHWDTIKEIKKYSPEIIHSVGFLLLKDKNYTTIAIAKDKDEQNFSNVMKIYNSCIIRQQTINFKPELF